MHCILDLSGGLLSQWHLGQSLRSSMPLVFSQASEWMAAGPRLATGDPALHPKMRRGSLIQRHPRRSGPQIAVRPSPFGSGGLERISSSGNPEKGQSRGGSLPAWCETLPAVAARGCQSPPGRQRPLRPWGSPLMAHPLRGDVWLGLVGGLC